MHGSALRQVGDGIRVFVRLTPKASSNRTGGLETAADGSQRIKVYVRSIPEKGKANKALTSFIAKTIGCAKSNVVVISGHTSRNKEVLIMGEAKALMTAAKALV